MTLQPDNAVALMATELSRAVGAVAVLNLPGFRQVPNSVRVFLGLTIASACFSAKLAHPRNDAIASSFLLLSAQHLVSGLAVALLWNLVLEACSIAIQLASVQSGLSYASLIDPTNDTESGSLLGITQFCLLITFLSAGLHLEFLAVLLESDSLWNHFSRDGATLGVIKSMLAFSFSTGLRLAAPFIASMLLLDVATAIAGRFAERFQISMLVFPIKWAATLLILLASTITLQELEGKLAIQALGFLLERH